MLDPIADRRVRDQVDEHPHRLVFASLSGAHLYGFPSGDSDVDVRGAHILPVEDVVGLTDPVETYEAMVVVEGLEVDVVTYDLKKFCTLILKKNGNVLEQVVSPLVLRSSAMHEELRDIALRCLTRHHVHHYRGMTNNRLAAFDEAMQAKPLLYALRAALTGIHLMRTGEVEPNLTRLIEPYGLPHVAELVERKVSGEKITLDESEAPRWRGEVGRLLVRLEEAFEASTLPEVPQARDELESLLVRARLEDR